MRNSIVKIFFDSKVAVFSTSSLPVMFARMQPFSKNPLSAFATVDNIDKFIVEWEKKAGFEIVIGEQLLGTVKYNTDLIPREEALDKIAQVFVSIYRDIDCEGATYQSVRLDALLNMAFQELERLYAPDEPSGGMNVDA